MESEESSGSSRSDVKSNILFVNFCLASQFTKKIKFNENADFTYSNLAFMAPERINGKIKPEDLEFAKRVDIWSVGVIMYVLFSGKLPFNGSNCQQLWENIKRCDLKFGG